MELACALTPPRGGGLAGGGTQALRHRIDNSDSGHGQPDAPGNDDAACASPPSCCHDRAAHTEPWMAHARRRLASCAPAAAARERRVTFADADADADADVSLDADAEPHPNVSLEAQDSAAMTMDIDRLSPPNAVPAPAMPLVAHLLSDASVAASVCFPPESCDGDVDDCAAAAGAAAGGWKVQGTEAAAAAMYLSRRSVRNALAETYHVYVSTTRSRDSDRGIITIFGSHCRIETLMPGHADGDQDADAIGDGHGHGHGQRKRGKRVLSSPTMFVQEQARFQAAVATLSQELNAATQTRVWRPSDGHVLASPGEPVAPPDLFVYVLFTACIRLQRLYRARTRTAATTAVLPPRVIGTHAFPLTHPSPLGGDNRGGSAADPAPGVDGTALAAAIYAFEDELVLCLRAAMAPTRPRSWKRKTTTVQHETALTRARPRPRTRTREWSPCARASRMVAAASSPAAAAAAAPAATTSLVTASTLATVGRERVEEARAMARIADFLHDDMMQCMRQAFACAHGRSEPSAEDDALAAAYMRERSRARHGVV